MNRNFIKDSNLVLREIFHSDKCLEIIKNFIQIFLEIQIKAIRINKNTIVDGKISRNYGIVDVRVITKEDKDLNVGIQIIDGDYIQNKMLLYYAKIHSNQILYNDKRKIAKTITINILDVKYFCGEKYDKFFNIKSNVINDDIIETIELYAIELPKFNRQAKKNISNKDAWMMYLKGENDEDINLAKQINPYINKLDNYINCYWKEEKI